MVFVGAASLNKITEKINLNNSPPLKLPAKIEQKIESFIGFLDKISFKHNSKSASTPNLSFIDNAKDKTINKNTKVLIIGDSQTVGTYGTKLDGLVRGTGAKVITCASWGSSPEWWFSGQKASSAWVKGTDAKESRPKDYDTPSIEKILKEEKPDVVIITMGGNMIANATQASVSKQVDKIGTAITASGAKLYWAGPPKYDPNKRTPEQLETFYGFLAKAVSTHGVLIDSRKFIDNYHGNDGLHYSGREGKKQTDKWATGVFNEIQKAKVK